MFTRAIGFGETPPEKWFLEESVLAKLPRNEDKACTFKFETVHRNPGGGGGKFPNTVQV